MGCGSSYAAARGAAAAALLDAPRGGSPRAALALAEATLRGVGGERALRSAAAALARCAARIASCAAGLEAVDAVRAALDVARRAERAGRWDEAGAAYAALLGAFGGSDSAALAATREVAAVGACRGYLRALAPVWNHAAAAQWLESVAADAAEAVADDPWLAALRLDEEGEAESGADLWEPRPSTALDNATAVIARGAVASCALAAAAVAEAALGGDADAESVAADAHMGMALGLALEGALDKAIAALDRCELAGRRDSALLRNVAAVRRNLDRRRGAKDTLYELLGLERDASLAEVRKVYRAAALALHPDRVRAYGSRVQRAAERRFVQIAEAYEVLSDAERRASYDLELAEAERKGERTVLLGGGGSGGSSGARRRAEKSSPPGDSVTDVPDEFAFQPQPLGDIEFAVVDTRRIPCDSRLVDARGTDRRTGERVTVRIRVPLDARAEGARLSAACWHVCLEMSVVESASAHARAMARCWAETALLGEEEAHGDDSGSAPA